jgi:hypothetical protein
MTRQKKQLKMRKHNKVLWHTKTVVNDMEQPTQLHKHVCVSTHTDGRLDISTSFLTTTSEAIFESSEEIPSTEQQMGDGILDNGACEPEFLDPEYIEHLMEMSLDPIASK